MTRTWNTRIEQNLHLPWNLTLPGPLYNQPSHEMKCEIFYIPSVAEDLKSFTKWSIKLQKIIAGDQRSPQS